MEAGSAVVGRKAISSSAVDKLKKKRKKRKKPKEGKRSSTSGNPTADSPESDGRTRPHKSRSALSCPPEYNQQPSRKASNNDLVEVCQTFNETLRWLPFIARHSKSIPPSSSNSRLFGPTVSKLNSNSLIESIEEEEERIAIYKMNRRKRYLAAQQSLLDLYPDTKVYASDDTARTDHRRLPNKTTLFPSPSDIESSSAKSATAYELVVPSIVASQDNIRTTKVM